MPGFDCLGGFEGPERAPDPALRVSGSFLKLRHDGAPVGTRSQEVVGVAGVSVGTGA